MRVLHIVRSLGVGGLEKVVIDLVRGMNSHGVESYVGCLVEEGDWLAEINVKGCWLGELGRRSPIGVAWNLFRYIKKNKIELVHTHNPGPHLFGCIAAVMAGVPLVHTKHGRNYPDNPRRVWLNRQLAKVSKLIVAVSDDVARVAVEIEKVPEKKVVVVRNGVGKGNVGAKALLPSGVMRQNERFVVGSVGRLASEKNYGLLVRAFAEFSREIKSARLLLVGDGQEREHLERLVIQCGIEGYVEFVGMQADVDPYFDAMDVFCLSSLTEGTSLTLLEAGAHGLPSVVTDVGGNGEIVANDETGFVVPPEDHEAIAKAFAKLYEDPELRVRMGTKARARIAARYSVVEMVANYRDIYERVFRWG